MRKSVHGRPDDRFHHRIGSLPRGMPKVLTDAEFTEVLAERDVFKLAIGGQTAIEALIDQAIVDAVEQEPGKQILRLPFRTRLSLAVALGVLRREYKGPLMELANV